MENFTAFKYLAIQDIGMGNQRIDTEYNREGELQVLNFTSMKHDCCNVQY